MKVHPSMNGTRASVHSTLPVVPTAGEDDSAFVFFALIIKVNSSSIPTTAAFRHIETAR